MTAVMREVYEPAAELRHEHALDCLPWERHRRPAAGDRLYVSRLGGGGMSQTRVYLAVSAASAMYGIEARCRASAAPREAPSRAALATAAGSACVVKRHATALHFRRVLASKYLCLLERVLVAHECRLRMGIRPARPAEPQRCQTAWRDVGSPAHMYCGNSWGRIPSAQQVPWAWNRCWETGWNQSTAGHEAGPTRPATASQLECAAVSAKQHMAHCSTDAQILDIALPPNHCCAASSSPTRGAI
jgi:hypothetical protein